MGGKYQPEPGIGKLPIPLYIRPKIVQWDKAIKKEERPTESEKDAIDRKATIVIEHFNPGVRGQSCHAALAHLSRKLFVLIQKAKTSLALTCYNSKRTHEST